MEMSTKSTSPSPDFVLRSRDTPITCVKFVKHRGTSLLLSGNQSGAISVWNLRSRRISCSVDAHPGHAVHWIHNLDKENELGVILSFGRDGIVNKWQATPTEWMKLGSFETTSIGFCPCAHLATEGGGLIATPTMQHSIVHLVDLDTGNLVRILSTKDNKKNGMCMYLRSCRLNGKCHLLAGYEDGSIALLDIENGDELSRTNLHSDALMAFDFCSDVNFGVSGSVDEHMSIFSIENGVICKMKSIQITNPGTNAITIRQDGRLFVTGGWDGAIRVFSVKKCSPLAVLNWHNQGVQTVAFADDNTLAAGSKDGNISIWSIYKT